MSSSPASTITSASPSFWHVMPQAPSSTCLHARAGILCVFICGRSRRSWLSQYDCIFARLCSTRSRSITGMGVSNSSTRICCSLSGRKNGDAIDLYLNADKLAPDRGAGWWLSGEELLVDFVVFLEPGHVAEIRVHFHHVLQIGPGALEDGLHIAERLAHLGRKAVRHDIGCRVRGSLTGDVDEAVGDDRMRVLPRGLDGPFHHECLAHDASDPLSCPAFARDVGRGCVRPPRSVCPPPRRAGGRLRVRSVNRTSHGPRFLRRTTRGRPPCPAVPSLGHSD